MMKRHRLPRASGSGRSAARLVRRLRRRETLRKAVSVVVTSPRRRLTRTTTGALRPLRCVRRARRRRRRQLKCSEDGRPLGWQLKRFPQAVMAVTAVTAVTAAAVVRRRSTASTSARPGRHAGGAFLVVRVGNPGVQLVRWAMCPSENRHPAGGAQRPARATHLRSPQQVRSIDRVLASRFSNCFASCV